MVIDYRALNNNLVPDAYKIPDKNNIIQLIDKRTWFSKFDYKSGFWQIRMHKDSIPWTAFSVPRGKYEWLVMPFGLSIAPQVFQRRMGDHLDYCMVYIDDVLVASHSEAEHLNMLKLFSMNLINMG